MARHRLHRLIVALLLATLPVMGMASFVREAQPACAMHMQGKPDHAPGAMAEHCKAMAHAAKTACKGGLHCAMCDDLSVSLAVNDVPLLRHALNDGVTLEPARILLTPTVATLWRPPRSR